MDTSSAPAPALPRVKSVESGREWYPNEARVQGREGRVQLEFNITDKGQAKDLKVLLAPDPIFERSAQGFLRSIHFDVPSKWIASGNAAVRYRLSIVFCLPPSGEPDAFPGEEIPVIITGSRIPGAPVRNPPPASASGACAGVLPKR